MKNKIIRLNESDLERLVYKIIKEEDEQQSQEVDNPKDVENFLKLADNYLFKKYGKYAGKIDTPKEKAAIIASLAKKWGVDASELSKVKTILNAESTKRRQTLNEININDTVKKLKVKGKVESHEEEKLLDYISKKIDGKIVGSSVVGDDFRMSITNKGFNVTKSGEKKRMFNFDQIGTMTKYINESRLDEAGGYDDPSIMAQHAGHSMGMLKKTLVGLQMVIPPTIHMLTSPELDKHRMMGTVGHLAQLVDETVRLMNTAMIDFTEEDMIRAKDTLNTHLDKLNRKLRLFQNLGDAYSREDFSNALYQSLLKTIRPLNEFTDKLISVDQRFTGRLKGKDRTTYNEPDID